MELIDKSAVENILRELWIEDRNGNPEHRICYNKALQEVQCKLDTLEVKEIDSNDAFIDKACEWLKKNKDNPFIECEDPCLSGYLTDEFIDDFRKALKGE